MTDIFWELMWYFVIVSMLSFGGVTSVIPETQRYMVSEKHWLSNEEFITIFGVASAAPGPNTLIMGLLAYKAAGPLAGICALYAMTLPSSVLAHYLGQMWYRWRDRPWRQWLQNGLTPVTVGLLLSSALILGKWSSGEWHWTQLVTAGVASLCFFTKTHPLWYLLAGSILGLLVGVT